MSMIGFIIILLFVANFAAAQQSTKTIGIKIISPMRGQQIPVNNNDLKVTGIASHNNSLSCIVYIIVNNIKPYQKALPTTSRNTANDYSTWIYNLVPSYTKIKAGTNKITSKLACQKNNTSLTQFYSINITGIATSKEQQEKALNSSNSSINNRNMNNDKKQTSIKKNAYILNGAVNTLGSTRINSQADTMLSTAGLLSLYTHQEPIKNTASHSNTTNTKQSTITNKDYNLNNNVSAGAKQLFNTSTGYTGFSSKHSDNNTKTRSLSVSMHLAKEPIHVGNIENMTLHVTDSNGIHVIAGAVILGKITTPSGISKRLEGITDRKGKASYSFNGDNTSGKYKVVMEATKPGYQNISISKTFKVLPAPANNGNTASSELRNINDNTYTNSKEATLPPRINSVRFPLIFSRQNPVSSHYALHGGVINITGRVYIPNIPNSFVTGRVYIPTPIHYNDTVPASNRVKIPEPETNNTRKLVKQDISTVQRPRLPNNNDGIPFTTATSLLHITKGMPDQLSSITNALNIIDRMRVIGFDSGGPGSPSKQH